MRDMRRSFRETRHLSKNFQLIHTSAREHSIAASPVPTLCSSKPAQLTILESTSSAADWRVFHELDGLAMRQTGPAAGRPRPPARGLRDASTF